MSFDVVLESHANGYGYSYFGQFEGFEKCGIRASDIYNSPPDTDVGLWGTTKYCTSRAQLLEAMSTGGRVGFDAPYNSKGGFQTSDEVQCN